MKLTDNSHTLDSGQIVPAGLAPVVAGFSVAVFHDFEAVEVLWRALEKNAILSIYQCYDWCKAWCDTIGKAENITPVLIVGVDAEGHPGFLLPLCLYPKQPFKCLHYIGGKHANFNMAVFAKSAIERFQGAALRDLIQSIHQLLPQADALELHNQPKLWGSAANPFSFLPHQLSPSMGHRLTLEADPIALQNRVRSASALQKLRKKEKKLQKMGAIHFVRTENLNDALALFEVFLKQKAERMIELGVHNAFDDAGVTDFFRNMIVQSYTQDRRLLQFFSLRCHDEVIAIYAGGLQNGRFSAYFNSTAGGRYAVTSPGDLLLKAVIADLCVQGVEVFDLGIGEARYKNAWSDGQEEVFDSFIAVRPRGVLAVRMLQTIFRFKRFLKTTPLIWKTINGWRRLTSEKSKPQDD